MVSSIREVKRTFWKRKYRYSAARASSTGECSPAWMVRPRCWAARWRSARGLGRRPGAAARISGGKRAVSRMCFLGWLSSSACSGHN